MHQSVTHSSICASQKRKPEHERDDRAEEFSHMSKFIGATYLSPAIIDYHRGDYLNRIALHDGQMLMPMPRYYKLKIFTPEQLGEMKGYFEKLAHDEEPLNEAQQAAKIAAVALSYQKCLNRLETAAKSN